MEKVGRFARIFTRRGLLLLCPSSSEDAEDGESGTHHAGSGRAAVKKLQVVPGTGRMLVGGESSWLSSTQQYGSSGEWTVACACGPTWGRLAG